MSSGSAPAISVVAPLYNKALYVGRCLESIRRQTFTDFEVVVVDDGSTDDSAAIAAAFCDVRIRVIRQANGGEGAARNRGIREAKADLIAFVDADDSWEPEFLEAIAALRRDFPAAAWMATGYRRVMGTAWDREVTIRTSGGRPVRLVQNYLVLAKEADFVTASSVALKRSVLEEMGGFVEGERNAADLDLWVRVAVRYPLAYDARVLSVVYTDAAGRMSNHPRARPHTPPPVRTLRRLLESGALSGRIRKEALSFADWLLFKHQTSMLYKGRRTEIERSLRQARFITARYRCSAAFLKASLNVLPVRVIAALRLKPVSLLWRLKRNRFLQGAISAFELFRGKTVVLRAVPGLNSPIAEGGGSGAGLAMNRS